MKKIIKTMRLNEFVFWLKQWIKWNKRKDDDMLITRLRSFKFLIPSHNVTGFFYYRLLCYLHSFGVVLYNLLKARAPFLCNNFVEYWGDISTSFILIPGNNGKSG